jgi:hypothetical protein
VDEVRKVENISAMKDKGFYVSKRRGVNIFVVSSLAGGTGSGMFLDIAFILRNLNPSSNVSGVFILPRVFARLPGADLIKANTYAALKEIETFSKIKDTEARVIDYGTDMIHIKRPPFDMTYVIDSVNEVENVINDVKILNSRVAEGLYILIGSEIGTGNTNAIDNIKSHLASAGLVNTHSASYCSFGVASCRWKAEEFTKNYERRQLESAHAVVNAMMDAPADAAAAKGDAARFVQERLLAKGYQRLAASLKGDFDKWLDDRQSGAGYLTYGEEFAKEVSARLLEMIDALDRRLSDANSELNKVGAEFEQFDKRIEAAKKKPHFWTGQGKVSKSIEDACKNYNGVIDKQGRKLLYREQVRHARDLVQAIWSHADSAGKQYAAVKEKMRAILNNLVGSGKGADFKVDRQSPFDYMLQFAPRPPELKTTPAEFVKWCRERYGSVYSFTMKPDEEIEAGIMEFVRADNVKLADLSIDYLLEEALRLKNAVGNGDARKQEEAYLMVKESLDQLSLLSAPLWRYNESEIPLTRKNINTKLSYCGVPNAEENPPAESYKGSWLAGANTRFIETIDQHRLIFFNITFGVPLFALQGIKEMEHEYFAKRDAVPCHLSYKWKNYLNLIPKQVGSVIGAFALAQVPYFGFIKSKDNYFTAHLKDVSGAAKEVPLARGRKEAFEVFRDKLHVVQNVSDAIVEKIDGEDLNKLKDVLQMYKDTLTDYVSSKEPSPNGGGNGSHSPNGNAAHPDVEFTPPESEEDAEFINREIEAMVNFLKEISSHQPPARPKKSARRMVDVSA